MATRPSGSPASPPELELNHALLTAEADLREYRLYYRLVASWLCSSLIPISALVAINIFLTLGPSDRATWDGWGTFFCLVYIAPPLITFVYWTTRIIAPRQLTIDKLRQEKRHILSLGTSESVGSRKGYRAEEVPAAILDYRKESARYRRVHNIFQVIVIVGSISASTVTTAVGLLPDLRWIAVAISLAVGIAAGITGYYKFRERSFNLQQTADSIEGEYAAVNLGIRRYKGLDSDKALEVFAEQVEYLREEQRKRQQQLDQPPDVREPST